MKTMPATMRTGRAASIIRLSSQHLKKAKNMEARQVARVVSSRLIFSPVAP